MPTPAPSAPAPSAVVEPAPVAAPAAATSTPPHASSPAHKAASSPGSGTPFNVGWSRKTLIGKTALKPDYHDVHGLSSSVGADTQMLKVCRHYLLYSDSVSRRVTTRRTTSTSSSRSPALEVGSASTRSRRRDGSRR